MGDALVSHTLFCGVQGTAPRMVTQSSPVRQMCRPIWHSIASASPFPVFPGESSLSASCRRRHRLGG